MPPLRWSLRAVPELLYVNLTPVPMLAAEKAMELLAPSASTKLTEGLSIQDSGDKFPPALLLAKAWFEAEASVKSPSISIRAVFEGTVISEGWPSSSCLVLSLICFPAACGSLMLFPLNKKYTVSPSCRAAPGISQDVSASGKGYKPASACGGCTDSMQRRHYFILPIPPVLTPHVVISVRLQGSSWAKLLLYFQQVEAPGLTRVPESLWQEEGTRLQGPESGGTAGLDAWGLHNCHEPA